MHGIANLSERKSRLKLQTTVVGRLRKYSAAKNASRGSGCYCARARAASTTRSTARRLVRLTEQRRSEVADNGAGIVVIDDVPHLHCDAQAVTTGRAGRGSSALGGF